jgi:tRNA G10  N-methylase Trm11
MEYLIRLAQVHETFRWPELESLANVEGISLDLVEYSVEVRKEPRYAIFSKFELVGYYQLASRLSSSDR